MSHVKAQGMEWAAREACGRPLSDLHVEVQAATTCEESPRGLTTPCASCSSGLPLPRQAGISMSITSGAPPSPSPSRVIHQLTFDQLSLQTTADTLTLQAQAKQPPLMQQQQQQVWQPHTPSPGALGPLRPQLVLRSDANGRGHHHGAADRGGAARDLWLDTQSQRMALVPLLEEAGQSCRGTSAEALSLHGFERVHARVGRTIESFPDPAPSHLLLMAASQEAAAASTDACTVALVCTPSPPTSTLISLQLPCPPSPTPPASPSPSCGTSELFPCRDTNTCIFSLPSTTRSVPLCPSAVAPHELPSSPLLLHAWASLPLAHDDGSPRGAAAMGEGASLRGTAEEEEEEGTCLALRLLDGPCGGPTSSSTTSGPPPQLPSSARVQVDSRRRPRHARTGAGPRGHAGAAPTAAEVEDARLTVACGSLWSPGTWDALAQGVLHVDTSDLLAAARDLHIAPPKLRTTATDGQLTRAPSERHFVVAVSSGTPRPRPRPATDAPASYASPQDFSSLCIASRVSSCSSSCSSVDYSSERAPRHLYGSRGATKGSATCDRVVSLLPPQAPVVAAMAALTHAWSAPCPCPDGPLSLDYAPPCPPAAPGQTPPRVRPSKSRSWVSMLAKLCSAPQQGPEHMAGARGRGVR